LEQTIGFGKLEDNINSSRLENLTKIRHDHAISALRELDHKNVIIHRHGGKFRNWISINFNFESWGVGDKNRQARSNDPRLLISDKYAGQAVDQGVDLGESEPTETNYEQSTEVIDQGHDLNGKIEVKPEAKMEIDNSAFISILNGIEERLMNHVYKFGNKLQDLEAKLQTSSIDQTTDNTSVESAPIHSSQAPTSNPQPTVENTVKAIPAAIERSLDTQADQSLSYEFPMTLSQQDRLEMQKTLLPQTGDKGQLMLNLLDKRLNNTADPIKNPMAYFASLVAKLKNGTLDLYAIEQEEAKQIEAQYQVIMHEFRQIDVENKQLCKLVNIEMEQGEVDLGFVATAEKMQLADRLRVLQGRIIEINKDPIVLKRNAMAQT